MRIKLIDDEDTPADRLIGMRRPSLVERIRDEIADKKELEDLLKELEEKKSKHKPKKIAVGLSASEILALMVVFSFPIVAMSTFVMNYMLIIIRSNMHEMFK